MATGSVLTIIFALVAGGLLVFGYMHEEKVIEFEDKLAHSIAKAIISSRKVKAAEKAEDTVSASSTAKPLTIKRRRTVSAAGSDSGRAA